MLTHTSLMHPRTLWEIEAAMRHAAEHSLADRIAMKTARSASGKAIVTVYHTRGTFEAFTFLDHGRNVTPTVLKALRASAKGINDGR